MPVKVAKRYKLLKYNLRAIKHPKGVFNCSAASLEAAFFQAFAKLKLIEGWRRLLE
jgi:hypothetical protein